MDTLFVQRLNQIRDTLICVAHNTTPATTLEQYQTSIDGRIAVIALIAGLIAALFSYLGWQAQRQSTKLLKQRNKRRPSMFPLIRKIYDDAIVLGAILEYDSDYEMSYTAEKYMSDADRSSNKKRFIFPISNIVINSLIEMTLPEDIIILDKFEICGKEDVYNLAYETRANILKYNKCISLLSKSISSYSGDESIIVYKNELQSLSRTIVKQLFLIDKCLGTEKSYFFKRLIIRGYNSNLELDFSLYVISRFFNSLKFLTPEYILADSHILCPNNIVDLSKEVFIRELYKKRKLLKIRAINSCCSEHQLLYSNLSSGIKCIEIIKYRKGRKTSQKSYVNLLGRLVTSIHKKIVVYSTQKNAINQKKSSSCINCIVKHLSISPSVLLFIDSKIISILHDKIVRPNYNDEPIRKITERCLGNIYQDLLSQIDKGSFNLKNIMKYDIILMMGTTKHNLLLYGSNQNYENERKRIKRKALWYKGKFQNCPIAERL